jgi:protein phosphatase 2C family protein 2/3
LQIFGVFDGHGGSKCAEYLKDQLHNNIIIQPEFPSNIPKAITKGSFKTEEDFLAIAAPAPNKPHNKAGSCAIMIMVVDNDVYVLNVGDSRALTSESVFPSDSQIYRAQTTTNNYDCLQMEATSNVR